MYLIVFGSVLSLNRFQNSDFTLILIYFSKTIRKYLVNRLCKSPPDINAIYYLIKTTDCISN